MSNKRSSRRVLFSHAVRYGTEMPLVHSSFLIDLSRDGASIETRNVFNPGTKVHLTLNLFSKDYKASGTVVWSMLVPPALARIFKNGMGIKFDKVDEAILKVYDSKLEISA